MKAITTCVCGKSYETKMIVSKITRNTIRADSRCQECIADHAETPRRLAAIAQAKRVAGIKLDHRYEDFDLDLLPERGKGVAHEFLAWRLMPGPGPGLLSVSGGGKSYLAFELRRRLQREGLSVPVIADSKVGELVYLEAARDRQRLIKAVERADVVLWDDFGTCKMTDAIDDLINLLLEAINENKTPVIGTTNWAADEIRARWARRTGDAGYAESRGDKILNRLKRACTFKAI